MSARLAINLPPHQLDEFQRAARMLLHTPLITAADAERFTLVRRWESVLRTEFGQKLGYRLDVSRSAARLLRRPTSVTSHRGARLPNGRLLSQWGYVYFALVLAVLEEPGTQVLATELVERIEQRSRGDERLALDSTDFPQRKGFSEAVKVLQQLGVLTVRDGDVEALVRDGQVLFDVDRDAAALCLVASPSILREVETVGDFVAAPRPSSMEARSREARQRLNRRLIDQPVVMLADLDADEVELAWKNRRREAENIIRLTGCDVELRAEGMALIDTTVEPLGGVRFPGSDSVAHAALLWLDAMLAAQVDAGGADDALAEGAIRSLSVDVADAAWNGVVERYGARFAATSREQPQRFRRDCLDLLARVGLLRRVADGSGHVRYEVAAAAARYRAQPAMSAPASSTQETLFA